jgi:hypothetical protein
MVEVLEQLAEEQRNQQESESNGANPEEDGESGNL